MNIGDIFRVATRPIVTIIFAATIAQVVTQGIDAPQWFLAMAGVVIIEWWGERTIRHIKNRSAEACPPKRSAGACPPPKDTK